jgi:putative glutamine amidotransferase
MIRVALPFGRTLEHKRAAYRKALRDAGITAVEDAVSIEGLDGLLLAGGTDVDPAIYGAAKHPETQKPDVERDRVEAALIREALERDIPMLAICRGQQMLNVVRGGTLNQHIEGHRCPGEDDAHAVTIEYGSKLGAIIGVGEYTVNSRHHQCVERVGDGLVVTATAGGIVEALEMPGKRFVVAVQWHPEDRTSRPDARLFAAFRDAMKLRTARAGERTRTAED